MARTAKHSCVAFLWVRFHPSGMRGPQGTDANMLNNAHAVYVPGVVKFFVFDLRVCLLPGSMKQQKTNLLACKRGKISSLT